MILRSWGRQVVIAAALITATAGAAVAQAPADFTRNGSPAAQMGPRRALPAGATAATALHNSGQVWTLPAGRPTLALEAVAAPRRRTVIGAVAGATIGALGGYLLASRADGCGFVCGAGEAGSAVVGGLVGAGAGILIAGRTD